MDPKQHPLLAIHPGDLIQHLDTGVIFLVTNTNLDTGGDIPSNVRVLARQMNDLRSVVGPEGTRHWEPNETALDPADAWVKITTNLWVGRVLHWGTFVAEQDLVTNVHRGDQYPGELATSHAVGDALSPRYPDDGAHNWPCRPGTTITAIDPKAGTITLSQVATRSGRFPLLSQHLATPI
jgi:hypothetical protein